MARGESYEIICQECGEVFTAHARIAKICKKKECHNAYHNRMSLAYYHNNHDAINDERKVRKTRICIKVDGKTYSRVCRVCGNPFESPHNRTYYCDECKLSIKRKRNYKSNHSHVNGCIDPDVYKKHTDNELIYDPSGTYNKGLCLTSYELPKEDNQGVIKNENFVPGTRFLVKGKEMVWSGSVLLEVMHE